MRETVCMWKRARVCMWKKKSVYLEESERVRNCVCVCVCVFVRRKCVYALEKECVRGKESACA